MKGTEWTFDAIVLGAGAAGLFCAAEAGARGLRVLALDHARKLGEKIRISGGGRCNFTNLHTRPENFSSENPKYCVSALKGFTPHDFLARIERSGIAWHEKALGQLFCDESARQVVDMLLDACRSASVTIRAGTSIEAVRKSAELFEVAAGENVFSAPRLVVATGGKSIPKIGATGFGYLLAEQFGLRVVPPAPALVPLTFEGRERELAKSLAGVSLDAAVAVNDDTPAPKRQLRRAPQFRDGFLFTHRGLSGPSILQISSYWREGRSIRIDLAPDYDLCTQLKERKGSSGRTAFQTALSDHIPRRLVQAFSENRGWTGNLADWSDARLREATGILHDWTITPTGSEGYRTAEVTRGGVDTRDLNSRTMGARDVPGLYFIGEVVDVTGWLGGYNFQWAWASAHAAARAMANA